MSQGQDTAAGLQLSHVKKEAGSVAEPPPPSPSSSPLLHPPLILAPWRRMMRENPRAVPEKG